MKAYKGFSPDLTSRLGSKKVKFEVGQTYEEEEAKTVRNGFHCCENPFECLSYYNYETDVFGEVEAAGSLDEDGAERIACTKITLKKLLTPKEFAFAGMLYIIQHPMRENWKQKYHGVHVAEQDAEAKEYGHIAIARGISPVVSAVPGAFVGLIEETEPGYIKNARFIRATKKAHYFLDEEGRVIISEVKGD